MINAGSLVLLSSIEIRELGAKGQLNNFISKSIKN